MFKYIISTLYSIFVDIDKCLSDSHKWILLGARPKPCQRLDIKLFAHPGEHCESIQWCSKCGLIKFGCGESIPYHSPKCHYRYLASIALTVERLKWSIIK